MKQINKALKNLGTDTVLAKADGYFYFTGADVELCYTTSVYVNSLNQLTLVQWIKEYETLREETLKIKQ